ncbi:MAG: hypothetical protein VKK97_03395 [Synechococcaceae cyanobacterium]|nr:hypothetical protein [Synechococcaceae cyanobacterium]
MTLSDGLVQRVRPAPGGSHGAPSPCRQCGGSGMLRLADQRYRTCLDCLGQGQVVPSAGATTAAALLQGSPAREISVSASAAR